MADLERKRAWQKTLYCSGPNTIGLSVSATTKSMGEGRAI